MHFVQRKEPFKCYVTPRGAGGVYEQALRSVTGGGGGVRGGLILALGNACIYFTTILFYHVDLPLYRMGYQHPETVYPSKTLLCYYLFSAFR